MSDTPRTDALLLEINEGRVYETDGPLANLARELERRLWGLASIHHRIIDAAERNSYRDEANAHRDYHTAIQSTIHFLGLRRDENEIERLQAGQRMVHDAALRELALAERQRDEAIELRDAYSAARDVAMRESAKDCARADEARAALRELVRLKDLHDRIEALADDYIAHDLDAADVLWFEEASDEYKRRKPLAWDTARRLLNQPDERKRG